MEEIPEGSSLWLVVQYQSLWWPQTSPLTLSPKSGSSFEWLFPATVGEPEDSGKEFDLLAVLTTPTVDQFILDWLKIGEEAEGKY